MGCRRRVTESGDRPTACRLASLPGWQISSCLLVTSERACHTSETIEPNLSEGRGAKRAPYLRLGATYTYSTYKADQGGNISDNSVCSNQMTYCDRCGRSFPHDGAYEQHISDSHAHWLCDSCDIDFASEESLEKHYGNSPRHHYCKECERHFDSDKSKMQHMEAKHWYCETHNRVRIKTYDVDYPVELSQEWYRSSIPRVASNHTTERVATTSIV